MIKEQLNMLWNIQMFEQNKNAITQKRQTLNSQEIKKIWNEIAVIASSIKEHQTELAACNSQTSKIESIIEELSGQLRAIENQLYAGAIKNVRELEQLRNKYDELKTAISLREDELLGCMEQSDQLAKQVAKLDEQLAEKKHQHEEQQRNIATEKALLDKSLLDIEDEISCCSQQIDKELLHIYNELKRSIDKPIAKLNNDFCGGCHRSLPITKVETAKVRMVYCDNCGRILIT